MAHAIERRPSLLVETNGRGPADSQHSDTLDRLAGLSTRIRPYSADALIVALICLGAATAIRLLGSWTHLGEFVDFLMYLVSAALTISFAHYCRVVLKRLHKRNLANEILAKELQHRSKNVCAVIDVIIRKSLADEPERAKKVFGRIKAMMSANELLAASQPQLLTLKQLLLQAFAPYGEDRIEAFGPEIYIEPDTARHLILLIHELVTNAVKYGALSRPSGRVFAHWREDGDMIVLNWKESRGPRVEYPKRQGFGSQLVAACIKALSGTMQQDFASGGFACSVRFKPTRR